MAPTPVGGSSSSSAAEAARQQRIAEARARAAAEAKARAAAQAKAHAAAQAQTQAEKQRTSAGKAQDKARQDTEIASKAQKVSEGAQQKKTTAQQELRQAQAALDAHNKDVSFHDDHPGEQKQTGAQLQKKVEEAQARFDKASTAATRIQEAAQKAAQTALTSRQTALSQANAALKAEKSANGAALNAGLPEPFRAANDLRDVYDAGSLGAQAQEQLFGSHTVVTQQEAVQADAKAVADATARSPREGATELQQQLSQSSDPAYRQALAKAITPSAEKITSALSNPATSPEDTRSIVSTMAQNADMVGPGARDALARQLNTAAGANDAAGQKVRDALKANATDPKTVALGAAMARQLRSANQYTAADAISNLSPEYKKAAVQSPKDAALRSEVDLNTVADERSQITDSVSHADADARAQANQVFALANKPTKELPPGVTVEPGSTPGNTTVTRRDAQGNITERLTAQRDGNKITLDSTLYDGKGTARRSIVSSDSSMGPTTVTQASWKQPLSPYPPLPPSVDELKNSRDPSVSLAETTVSQDCDGLHQSVYTQDARSGVTQTTKDYSTQDNKDGITDRLSDNFKDGNVDKVEIHSTNIPPAGAQGPDGKPAKSTVTHSTSYSQGDVRLTGADSKAVDHEDSCVSPNASDIDGVEHKADDADSSPKSWTLEKSKTNELDTQTFLEGNTDVSVVNTKKIEGNTVTETTSGKVPNPKDPDDDPVDIKGHAERTYNDRGQVVSASSDQTDATGTERIQDYQRLESKNAQGETEVTENTTSSEQPKDGPSTRAEQSQTAVQTAQGPELVRASQRLSTADGTSEATITPEGQQLTVNGQQVDTPEQLEAMPDAQRALGNSAVTGLSNQLSDFSQMAATLPGGPSAKQTKEDKGEQKAALSASNSGLFRLQQATTTRLAQASGNPAQDPSAPGAGRVSSTRQEGWVKIQAQPGQTLPSVSPTERLAGGATGGVMLAANAVGVYNSVRALSNDFSQHNYLNAAKDGLSLALSAKGVYSGTTAVVSAITGSSKGLTLGGSIGTVGGKVNPAELGKLAGGAGVLLGVAAGGAEVIDGIQRGDGWQIASGAVTAGAAVGGFLAAGAAAGAWGGPAGAAVGLAIGALAFGATELFDWLDDSEHDVADQKI